MKGTMTMTLYVIEYLTPAGSLRAFRTLARNHDDAEWRFTVATGLDYENIQTVEAR